MAVVVVCQQCGAENPPTFNFCGHCGRRLGLAAAQAEPVAEPVPGRPAVPERKAGRAERRQLTVMFCDLVGSTALSVELDPEDLRDVVRSYQRACAEVVAQFEGYIAQYLGDGILVYFGYPAAHEDAAARAVRAGLRIVRAVRVLGRRLRQEKGVDLAVRIGVHTGLVVVGEVGEGTRREQLALGDTPNLAARLQDLAAPNELVISGLTHRLVSGLFECESLGPQALKGFDREAAVYRVVEERDAVSPLDLISPNGRLLLFGRERELERLAEQWTHVCRGSGRVVAVCGEAGIGKTHLVHVFKQELASTPHTRLECRCSPYHQHSAFHPVVDLLQRMLNFYPEQPPEERLDMIAFMLEQNGLEVPVAVPLMARLLGVPLDARFAPSEGSPPVQRKHTQNMLWQLLENLAEERPLLFIIEDLHWADPSTLSLLGQFIEKMASLPVLVVPTYRPAFLVPWPSYEHASTISLERLGREQVERIVLEVAKGKAMPEAVLDQIVRKTDGIPLFVQELTKMVLETGLLTEHEDHYELDGNLPPLAIPATLQDSLMARLDRLSPVKEVAQISAALGREFSYRLLEAVAQMRPPALQEALRQLVEAEVLYLKGQPPEATYLFKHVLIQEAAYESLLRSQRQVLHRQIAARLEALFPEQVHAEPELVAHHYSRAGLGDKAAAYWQEAGRRALEQSANLEAQNYFSRGLALLEGLAETPERLRLKLMLLSGLGSALLPMRGYAHPEVSAAFEQARVLSRRVQDVPQRLSVLHGLWANYTGLANHEAAEELAWELLRLADATEDEMQVLEAKRALASTLHWRGELEAARDMLAQALAAHEGLQHRPPSSLFSDHPVVSCGAYLSVTLWTLGYPEQAEAAAARAVRQAEALAHPYSLAYALGFRTLLNVHLRDRPAAHTTAAACLELAERYGFTFWQGVASILLAWTLIAEDAEAGIHRMQQALAAFRASGVRLWVKHPLALLAEALGAHGRPEEGLALVDEGIAIAQGTGELVFLPELYRHRGELLLQAAPGRAAEAETCFRQALDLAQRQGARPLVLRALVSLARLLPHAHPTVRRDLADACAAFTEGRHLSDLVEARALLDAWS